MGADVRIRRGWTIRLTRRLHHTAAERETLRKSDGIWYSPANNLIQDILCWQFCCNDDDDDDDDDNNNNNNEKLKGKFGSCAGKTFDRFTTKDSYTWNITHNTESAAVWSLKRERWGSLLVQEKYREEMACDRRHPYRIIIIIIIIIIIMRVWRWNTK